MKGPLRSHLIHPPTSREVLSKPFLPRGVCCVLKILWGSGWQLLKYPIIMLYNHKCQEAPPCTYIFFLFLTKAHCFLLYPQQRNVHTSGSSSWIMIHPIFKETLSSPFLSLLGLKNPGGFIYFVFAHLPRPSDVSDVSSWASLHGRHFHLWGVSHAKIFFSVLLLRCLWRWIGYLA